MDRKRILIVDDDLDVCNSIVNYMQDNNTEVRYTASVSDAICSLMKFDFCLMILSNQLSGIGSIEILKLTRLMKCTPILMLTMPLAPDEKIALFQAGANAIVEKPLNIDLCVAQAEAIIWLSSKAGENHNSQDYITFETELIILPHYRLVLIDGKPLSLTRKEFDLLCYFARNPGRVFSREQLYARIWDNSFVDSGDETVRVHIQTLRKKLEAEGKHCIYNVWGVGYKFVPPGHL